MFLKCAHLGHDSEEISQDFPGFGSNSGRLFDSSHASNQQLPSTQATDLEDFWTA